MVIPIGIPVKEAKAEFEIHPVLVEAKIRECSKYFRVVQPSCVFYSSIHLALFL